jgi:hypothetical protein
MMDGVMLLIYLVTPGGLAIVNYIANRISVNFSCGGSWDSSGPETSPSDTLTTTSPDTVRLPPNIPKDHGDLQPHFPEKRTDPGPI